MSLIKLVKVGAIVAPKNAVRKDGKAGCAYYQVSFQDANNPMADARKRNIFQKHNSNGVPQWTVSREGLLAIIGTEEAIMEGAFKTFKVADYTIGERTVNTYKTVLFAHELDCIPSTLKSLGHELLVATPAKVVAAPVSSKIEA